MAVAPPVIPGIESPEVAKAGVEMIFGLAECWNLSRPELARLLGIRSTSTLDNWRKKAPESLSPDTLERISYLLHIYRSLQQLLPEERADQWIRRPNRASPFLGTSALEYMLQGQVRHLLDTHRYLKNAASSVSDLAVRT
jgi:transcriptional regulator with XRE-family HTH domain